MGVNAFDVYYFAKDKIASDSVRFFTKRQNINAKKARDPSEIDYTRKFIIINSSNVKHHRTLCVLKNIRSLDGYFHIDDHDDVGLGAVVRSGIGPANWVENVFEMGLRVIFVGQQYWKHTLFFRGFEYSGLYRNNLHKYPFSNVFLSLHKKTH